MRAALLTTLLALPALCLAAPTWTVSPFQQKIIMGVSMSDATHGYIAGADDGSGANVLKTSDGAQTFEVVPIHPALMLMSITSQSPTAAVTTGIGLLSGSTQYTNNGSQFTNSSEPNVSLQQTLDVSPVLGDVQGFVVTGAFSFFGSNETINGVSYSADGGATFTFSDIGTPSEVPARYGSFPSSSVGFVASGTWPNDARAARAHPGMTLRAVTRNLDIVSGHAKDSKAQAARLRFKHPRGQDQGWAAVISKSVDGFQTWTTVYTNDTFYFNQISCPTETVCYAAAENDDMGFGFKTADGGETWSEVLAVAGVSMMSAQAVSEDEAWFGGGMLTPPANINGTLFHTTDAGASFDVTYLDGQYLMDLDMLDSNHGFAAAMNEQSSSNVLIYA